MRFLRWNPPLAGLLFRVFLLDVVLIPALFLFAEYSVFSCWLSWSRFASEGVRTSLGVGVACVVSLVLGQVSALSFVVGMSFRGDGGERYVVHGHGAALLAASGRYPAIKGGNRDCFFADAWNNASGGRRKISLQD